MLPTGYATGFSGTKAVTTTPYPVFPLRWRKDQIVLYFLSRLLDRGSPCYPFFFLLFFFFHLTYSRWTSSLPSCLWSQRILPSLPGSRLTIFLSRCKFSTLTTRQPMVAFYLLTFPRFPLRKKEHKSYFGKTRIHDFRTSRCAAYLLDHSGDERIRPCLLNNKRFKIER